MEKVQVFATAKHPNRSEGEPIMVHPNHLPKFLRCEWVVENQPEAVVNPKIEKPTKAKVKRAKKRIKE